MTAWHRQSNSAESVSHFMMCRKTWRIDEILCFGWKLSIGGGKLFHTKKLVQWRHFEQRVLRAKNIIFTWIDAIVFRMCNGEHGHTIAAPLAGGQMWMRFQERICARMTRRERERGRKDEWTKRRSCKRSFNCRHISCGQVNTWLLAWSSFETHKKHSHRESDITHTARLCFATSIDDVFQRNDHS